MSGSKKGNGVGGVGAEPAGITAYCEEPAEGRKANATRESNDPFRGARQPVARNADRDGEATVLDLRWRGAIRLSLR
jgi:hypothetical protein